MKQIPHIPGEVERFEHDGEVYVQVEDYAALNEHSAMVEMVLRDERDELRALLDACAPYLKEGETPAECIARNRRDVDIALSSLARDRARVAELEVIATSICAGNCLPPFPCAQDGCPKRTARPSPSAGLVHACPVCGEADDAKCGKCNRTDCRYRSDRVAPAVADLAEMQRMWHEARDQVAADRDLWRQRAITLGWPAAPSAGAVPK